MRQRFLDFQARITDVAKAQTLLFLQAAFKEVANRLRRFVRERIPIGLGAKDGSQRVGYGVASEGFLRRKHFVENAAERPDVRALIERLTFGLLRTHVSSSAENCAG